LGTQKPDGEFATDNVILPQHRAFSICLLIVSACYLALRCEKHA